ncbi:MAG: DGQHR domain-containing protein [Clostridia bacterium]|nr:DGQHR domain-containing protein [Clostridia bacterium]
MAIKIPAIRSKIGIWYYYVSSLSFEQVNKYVRPIDDELHHSDLLSGMIQRSITSNYKSIANYIETQEERFFNSLILAVYDGQPKWNEIRTQDETGEDNYNLGIITLTDDVKIFPVDGQHRVAGIKKAIKDNPDMKLERVPVIFIGHSTDEIGMQRTRRMFSTLNRYAKPVSLRDIIALDEDDVVAIASRNLIDNTNIFVTDRILDSKNKSIPDSNNMALTSIITYYECNKELLWLHIKDTEVVGLEEKPIRGRAKIKEYIRHRPKDEIISIFTQECKEFWDAIVNKCPEVREPNITVGAYRDNNGGHLFFRPIALYPFTKASVRIKEHYNKSYTQIIESIPPELLWIQNRLWRKIIWDDVAKKMVMGNATQIELMLLYIMAPELLNFKEKKKMIDNLKSIWDETDENIIIDRLDSIIRGDEFV